MRRIGLALTAAWITALSGVSTAQTVSLTSNNGTMTLTGKLIEIDDQQFHIRTEFGNMWVARDQVTCAGSGCPGAEGKVGLIIHGSDALGKNLMPALVEGYVATLDTHVAERVAEPTGTTLHIKDTTPQGRDLAIVAVETVGPDAGLEALVEDVTDIAVATRPARAAEVKAIADQGRGVISDIGQEYVIAADTAMAIVSADVRIDALSIDDLTAVFAGQVTNWAQLGGPNVSIVAYTPDVNSGARRIFQQQALGPRNTDYAQSVKIVPSEQVLAGLVAETPGAIGLISTAQPHQARQLDVLETCGIRRSATPFAIKTNEYPLQNRLRLFTDNADLPELAQGLLDFTLTPEADALIKNAGFVSLEVQRERPGNATERFTRAVATADGTEQARLLNTMVEELRGARRLSTTFQLIDPAAKPDAVTARDMDRLLAFLSDTDNIGRDVFLVGFSDNQSSLADAAQASRVRAATIGQALIRRAGTAGADLRLRATGYGSLLPIACNETQQGRERNNRVEVWLR